MKLEHLYLCDNQLSGQFFYFSEEWSVPTDHLRPPSFRFFVGELPLSIIKMKTRGVSVSLNDNIGFTLPDNMNDLGDVEKLDLSNCLLTGLHLSACWGGQSGLTI